MAMYGGGGGGDLPPTTNPPSEPPAGDVQWDNAVTSKVQWYNVTYSIGGTPTELSTTADIYNFLEDPRDIIPRQPCHSDKDRIWDAIANKKTIPGTSKIDYVAGGVNPINATATTASSYLCDWINKGDLKTDDQGRKYFWVLVWEGSALNDDTSATNPQDFYYSLLKYTEGIHFFKRGASQTAGVEVLYTVHDTDPGAIRKIATLTIGTATTTATTITWAFDFDNTSGEIWNPDRGKQPKVRLHLVIGASMTYVSSTYAGTSVTFAPSNSTTTLFYDLLSCTDGNLIITFSGTYGTSYIHAYIESEDGTPNPLSYIHTATDPRTTSNGSKIGYKTS